MSNVSPQQAFQMAQKFHSRGELDKAEGIYRSILDADRFHADSWFYLGMIYYAKGITQQAIEFIKNAVEHDKTNPSYHNNLGEMYRQLNMIDHAEFHLSAAVQIKPDYADALSNLALVYKSKGDIERAKLCFADALQHAPESVNTLINTGNLLKETGEFDDAMNCYEAALKIDPENSFVLNTLADCYTDMGDYNAAASALSIAIKGDSSKHEERVKLAFITLRNKDFRKGFQLYESRYKQFPEILEGDLKTLWRGTSLMDKTLYVYAERAFMNSFGDTLMFSRFLFGLEKDKPAKVIFKVQQELVSLLKDNMPDFVEVVSDTPAEFDLHSPLMSLPMVQNIRAKSMPMSDAWIKADSLKVTDFSLKMASDKKKIGILSDDEELIINLKSDDVQLFYIGDKTEEPLSEGVIDMSSDIDDFSDIAAMFANLDEIVTADNVLVHLAGSMGVETTLLLDELYDWRWFNVKDGQKTLWYNSVTANFGKN